MTEKIIYPSVQTKLLPACYDKAFCGRSTCIVKCVGCTDIRCAFNKPHSIDTGYNEYLNIGRWTHTQ